MGDVESAAATAPAGGCHLLIVCRPNFKIIHMHINDVKCRRRRRRHLVWAASWMVVKF